ncbi:MAG: flagellar motor protein MotB [Bradymonadia bacterium]
MEDEADQGDGGGGLEEELVCPEGAPEWLVTFGDMMSLLLTFFILLLSFANMDALKFKQISGSIKQALGVEQKEQVIIVPKAQKVIPIKFSIDYNAMNMSQKLKREMDPLSNSKKKGKVNIQVYETYRGVTVLMPAHDIFEAGTDTLKPVALPILAYLAQEAANSPNELVVEVRAPEDAPRAVRFSDHWELTTAQAVVAARYIRSSAETQGYTLGAAKVHAVGRGSAPLLERREDGSIPALEGPAVNFLFLSNPLNPGRR